jgi:hypothetical protein
MQSADLSGDLQNVCDQLQPGDVQYVPDTVRSGDVQHVPHAVRPGHVRYVQMSDQQPARLHLRSPVSGALIACAADSLRVRWHRQL